MSNSFQKRKEDFICEHCGCQVQGSGYTNHCPDCLWGKHVDVNPGDRAETCQGLMEPKEIIMHKGNFRIKHQCTVCGIEREVKTQDDDKIVEFLESLKDGK